MLDAPLAAAPAGDLARRFAALGDPALLSILAAAPDGEVCVCDFVAPLGKAQPAVSHHLKVLADAGLVEGERPTKWVWYGSCPGAWLRCAPPWTGGDDQSVQGWFSEGMWRAASM